MNYPTLQAISNALEIWAPPESAQSYDNVGLQVGDPDRAVRKVLIALDATPAVLEEAQNIGADLIITHHPLLFKPLRHLTPQTFVSNLAFRLAQSGIALYSIHTNLDAAPAGVSFALAHHLGLEDVRFLDIFQNANDSGSKQTGLGAIGRLAAPETLTVFLKRVADRLEAPALRYTGTPDQPVQSIAVCGGSGSSLVAKAIEAGADAFVTADITYHIYFDALYVDGTPRIALIDAGHYETEFITEQLLVNWLQERFPACTCLQTRTRTSPVRTFLHA
jgi:dinuclear metal center YbgI/SA1388 family protein